MWSLLMALMICGPCAIGCAAASNRSSQFPPSMYEDGMGPDVTFEYGKPNKFLDGLASMASFPSRVLPMTSKVNSHILSRETTDKLAYYLRENDLGDVLVRVNQYDPAGEWRRLRKNSRIAPGWRYTFGTAGLVQYTLFPVRLFGGDYYNPFTNSLYVNSDLPAVLIVEAAYAKDVHSRRLPGTYAAINEFPVLKLWRYKRAVDETIGYANLTDDWNLEKETYRVVYPLMGIEVGLGGQTGASVLTPLPILTVPIAAIGGAAAGHIVGQTTIRVRERQRVPEHSFDTLKIDESESDTSSDADANCKDQLSTVNESSRDR